MSKGNRKRRREAGLLPEPVQCHAHNRHGEPCKNHAMHGQNVCNKHGGKAKQNLIAAERRLASKADVLMKELIRIATSAESEAVRLAAVRDALDRIGIGTNRALEVTVAPWSENIEGLFYDVEIEDAEVIEDEPKAIPPSDWESKEEAADMEDHPPQYGTGKAKHRG